MVTPHVETPREEVVNAITHGLGFAASLLGLAYCWQRFGHLPMCSWGTGVFCWTLALLLLCSTSYHACTHPGLKDRLHRCDHAAIYLFIAGSYTPFCLMGMSPQVSSLALTLCWGLGLSGAVFALSGGNRFPSLSLVLYLLMGWMAVVWLPEWWVHLSPAQLGWMVCGGLSYTLGSLFFATHFFRFSHAVWHLFVLGGSGCHFVSMGLLADSFRL